jgi:hypothetical protein
LWAEALRMRAVSSWGERSAIERKWRGAKGDVWGVPEAEVVMERAALGLVSARRQELEGRRRRVATMVAGWYSRCGGKEVEVL